MKKNSCKFSVISRKKKITILLTTYYLLLTTFIGCAKREIKNIDSKGTTIVCFGDSLTFGYGATQEEAYPAMLAKMIKNPVINAGIDGDTSTEALKRLDNDVLDRDAFLVIIEFGGNDFLRKVPREVTLSNIKEMVERIQARGIMVAVTDISAGMIMKDYRPLLYNLAKEKSAIFISDIFSGIITNPALKSDFIHPNNKGYKIIAERIHRQVLPYLNQNTLIKKFKKQ